MIDTWFLQAGKWVFPQAVWKLDPVRKEIAITFDDGPEPGITEEVLEILDHYGMKATFFCLGNKAEKNPSLMQMIIENGHSVGNHSFSHPDGFRTRRDAYIRDVERAGAILQTSLFRPPFGRINPLTYRILARKYQVVFWNVMSYDYHHRFSPGKCLDHCVQNLKNGAIYVFHDTSLASPKLLSFLSDFLDQIKAQGFQTVKLGSTTN